MAAPGAVAADWRQFRHFLTADALRTFKIERMANWTINPRLRTVTAHVADMSFKTTYYVCSHVYSGCEAQMKIVEECSATGSREFIIATVFVGRLHHTNHPPFVFGQLEAYVDGHQL
uniref:Uncharacterized protein n=1 Tax=Meloidogyne incognita TaxID=6306 RepID=A0A914L5Q4_MELIC